MRQRSITGPLIVIVIGLLFLVNNLRPDFSPFALVADYWPFLLILAGVIGLVEVLVAVGRGTPAPPRPLGGGWVFWIILFAIIAGIMSDRGGWIHVRPYDFGGVTILGSDYDYPVAVSGLPQAVPAGVTRIVLDNLHGNVSLKGDDSNAVKIDGQKQVRAFSRSNADEADRSSQLEVQQKGDALVVSMPAPNLRERMTISADLDISIPKGLNVELTAGSAI